MPEILTRHPDIVLKILKDAKISCGTGANQHILTTCPKDQFCALPTGELCIYGTNQISQMTQLHALNFMFTSSTIIPFTALGVMVFLIGLMVGIKGFSKKQ